MGRGECTAPPRRWMLWCGMLAVAAVCVSLQCPAVVCGILLGGMGLAAVWRRRDPVVLAFLSITALFLLVGSGFRYAYKTTMESMEEVTDTVTGQITGHHSGGWYTLQITESACLRPGVRVLLYCPDLATPERYDRVSTQVTYQSLGEEGDRYRADRILLRAMPTGYGENALTVLETGRPGVRRSLAMVRERLSRRLRCLLPGQEGAVLTAMCLVDKQYLSADTEQAFRSCGLPHILVVSGLHLSVVIGAVYALGRLLRLPGWVTVAVTAAVMLLYSALVGFSPSVCRAGIMALMLLAGRLVRRPADGLNSMGLALCLILLVNPYALYDVGLQLSFSAAGGVLALTPRLLEMTAPPAEKHPWCRPILAGLCTTVGASIPLSPFLAAYFGELSWISPLANLAVVPVAGVLLLLGCLALLCLSCPPISWCGRGICYVAGWMVKALRGFCIWLDRWTETASVPAGSFRMVWLTVGCILLAVWLYRRQFDWFRRTGGLLLAVWMLLYPGEALVRSGRYYVSVASGNASAVVMIRQKEQCLLLVQDAGSCGAAGRLWRQEGAPAAVVLAVGEGTTADAAGVMELRKTTGAALLLAADGADWAAGLPVELYPLEADCTVTVGNGITLTRLEDGWWRIRMKDTCLLVSPTAAAFSPRKIPKESVDGLVFCGEIVYNDCWTQVPESIWIGTRAQQRAAESLPVTPKVTVSSDAGVTLSTRGQGDWRYSL